MINVPRQIPNDSAISYYFIIFFFFLILLILLISLIDRLLTLFSFVTFNNSSFRDNRVVHILFIGFISLVCGFFNFVALVN